MERYRVMEEMSTTPKHSLLLPHLACFSIFSSLSSASAHLSSPIVVKEVVFRFEDMPTEQLVPRFKAPSTVELVVNPAKLENINQLTTLAHFKERYAFNEEEQEEVIGRG